jgi:thiol:disulfide interchange protein
MILTNIFLLQISTTGIIVGLVFFLVCAAFAFLAFKMLKKTVKMAVRMAIVAAILIVALIGSIAFLMFSYGNKDSAPTKPAPTRTNR